MPQSIVPVTLEGRRLLTEWFERTRLTQGEAAARIGIHRVHLNQFLTGERRPGLDAAILIEERTGVPIRAWRRNCPVNRITITRHRPSAN